MSRDLFTNTDGANAQAQAVLAMITRHGQIEKSWNDEYKHYDAESRVARWENCREQGYIVSLKSKDHDRQLNIAFFEHRNGDNICALKWEQKSINTIHIDNAMDNNSGNKLINSYDITYSVTFGEIVKMADWIYNELTKFWIETSKVDIKPDCILMDKAYSTKELIDKVCITLRENNQVDNSVNLYERVLDLLSYDELINLVEQYVNIK